MKPSNNLENKTPSDILKSSASTFESSGSQSLRSTTGTQSRPDAFDESRFIMTFLTILGVAETLCSFRLVLEERTGKEIPKSSGLEFFKKFLANNVVLSDAKIEWKRYNRFTFVENTISNLPKILRAKFLGRDGQFGFISMYKFGSFKHLFATITSLS